MTGRLLTAREVAGQFSVTIETVLRWHRSGRLPRAYRLGPGVLRWRETELERWLEAHREGVVSGSPWRDAVSTDTSAPARQETTDAR